MQVLLSGPTPPSRLKLHSTAIIDPNFKFPSFPVSAVSASRPRALVGGTLCCRGAGLADRQAPDRTERSR
jgi:hypothetical protein